MWALQRAERERFIRYFGADLVIVPGDQLTDRLRHYQHFSQEVAAGRPTAGPVAEAEPPVFDLGDELTDCDTVGIIYDQTEGLNFYAEFGHVEAVFADPALLRRRLPRQRLIDYLDDDSVSPLPFRRLAERYPDTAGTVFARLLHRPGFDWNRDGEALLRERKAAFFDRPARPSISPVSDRLARYLRQS